MWSLPTFGRSAALGHVSTPCQGERTSGMTSEKQLLLIINLGRVIRPSPSYLKCTIPQWGGLFPNGETVDNLPRSGCLSKFSLRSEHLMLTDKKKTPRPRSCDLQVSVRIRNVYLCNRNVIKGRRYVWHSWKGAFHHKNNMTVYCSAFQWLYYVQHTCAHTHIHPRTHS